MFSLSVPHVMRTVVISKKKLECFLRIPDHSKSLIIFARGSGGSRLSLRNTHVAEKLVITALRHYFLIY